MTYRKPEVVQNGTAINAIEAGVNKIEDVADSAFELSPAAYRSDE